MRDDFHIVGVKMIVCDGFRRRIEDRWNIIFGLDVGGNGR